MPLELSVNLNVAQYIKRLKKFGQEFSAREMLKTIGTETREWIEEVFRTEGTARLGGASWKPLRPNTVASKAYHGYSSGILDSTGKLRNSFRFSVYPDSGEPSVVVWTGNPYARFHQDGTKGPYFIFPRKVGGLLSFVTVAGRVYATHVIHPGLPKRRFMPTKGEQIRIARYAAAYHIEKALGEE